MGRDSRINTDRYSVQRTVMFMSHPRHVESLVGVKSKFGLDCCNKKVLFGRMILFQQPPITPREVFSTSLDVFGKKWQLFVRLALSKMFADLVVTIVGVVCLFATCFDGIMKAAKVIGDDEKINIESMTDKQEKELLQALQGILVPFLIVVTCMLLIRFMIAAVYEGATIQSAARILANGGGDILTPEAGFKAGRQSMKNLMIYYVALCGLVSASAIPLGLLAAIILSTQEKNPTLSMALMLFALLVGFVYVSTRLVAAPYFVVTRGFGPFRAIQASFRVSRNHFWFAFCAIFLWSLIVIAVNVVLRVVLMRQGGGLVGMVVYALVLLPLTLMYVPFDVYDFPNF